MDGQLAPKRFAPPSGVMGTADMAMQPLTVSQAIAYVQALEAEWNCPIIRVVTVTQNGDDETALDITTVFGDWVVWREPSGRIYGEC